MNTSENLSEPTPNVAVSAVVCALRAMARSRMALAIQNLSTFRLIDEESGSDAKSLTLRFLYMTTVAEDKALSPRWRAWREIVAAHLERYPDFCKNLEEVAMLSFVERDQFADFLESVAAAGMDHFLKEVVAV